MAEAQSAKLEDILRRVVRALLELPIAPRSALERQRAAGRLYPMHALVVAQIARGLLFRPEIFLDIPDAAGRGALLLERQARAAAWLTLRALLLGFADACQDSAQQEQVLAVEESGQVAEQVLRGLRDRARWPGLDHGARLGALLMGLIWRQETMTNGGRPRKPRAAEAGAAPTPRQAQAAEARRQERKEALRALFQQWMTKR